MTRDFWALLVILITYVIILSIVIYILGAFIAWDFSWFNNLDGVLKRIIIAFTLYLSIKTHKRHSKEILTETKKEFGYD